jgi:hypothetical protein
MMGKNYHKKTNHSRRKLQELKGHAVTVLEAAPDLGGMLRWAIPPFRLPSQEVDHAIGMLEKMGVLFQTGRRLGRELDVEKLERNGMPSFWLPAVGLRPNWASQVKTCHEFIRP